MPKRKHSSDSISDIKKTAATTASSAEAAPGDAGKVAKTAARKKRRMERKPSAEGELSLSKRHHEGQVALSGPISKRKQKGAQASVGTTQAKEHLHAARASSKATASSSSYIDRRKLPPILKHQEAYRTGKGAAAAAKRHAARDAIDRQFETTEERDEDEDEDEGEDEEGEAEEASSGAGSGPAAAGTADGEATGPEAVNVDASAVDFSQVDSSLAEYSLRRGFGTARVPYRNKHRVLVFSSRGLTMRYRHLLDDLRAMLPHHKKESKLDAKDQLRVVNEIAEVNRCDLCVFFEVRKRRDCFLWISKTPQGPSARFHLLNLHTMDELRLTGNCLRGSRPLLSFDRNFESGAHWQLVKELLTQSFGTPRGHPKSQPFYDHVISFALVEGKIWFRHYQILDTAKDPKEVRAALASGQQPTSLVEIGPRFVLDLVRVFKGSFGGPTLWQNGDWVSPNKLRHLAALAKAGKYAKRLDAKEGYTSRREELVLPDDGLAGVFAGGEKRGLEAQVAARGGGADAAAIGNHQDGDSDEEEEEEEEDERKGSGRGDASSSSDGSESEGEEAVAHGSDESSSDEDE